MRAVAIAFVLLLAGVVWSVELGITQAAAEVPNSSATKTDAKALVARLGDRSFAVREAATTELAQMDISVRPHLEEALKNRDAEVRTRARRILAIVNERDFEQRLTAFAADMDDKHKLDLPGWSRYKQIVGNTRAARELFVLMQRAEPKLLAAAETEPAAVDRLLTTRLGETFQAAQFGSASGINSGSSAAIVFVATNTSLKLSNEAAELIGAFIYQPAFYTALSGSREAELKKLLEAWVMRETDDNAILSQNVGIALKQGLAVGRTLATKALNQKDLTPEGARQAMSLLARTGTASDAAQLERFLKDETVLAHFNPNEADRDLLKVCDYAMAMMIHLAGKNPLEFRSGPLRWQQGWNAELQTLAFPTESDRRAALDKWSEWWSTHEEELTKQPAEKNGS